MRARKIAWAMVVGLLMPSVVAGQERTPDTVPRVARFLEPLPPLTEDWLGNVPPVQRAPAQALHEMCALWADAPDQVRQRAAAQDSIRRLAAMPEQSRWVGLVKERKFSGAWGSLKLRIAPGITIQTADEMARDRYGTRFPRGSSDFQTLTATRHRDVLSYRVRLLRPLFVSGRCTFLARISQLRRM